MNQNPPQTRKKLPIKNLPTTNVRGTAEAFRSAITDDECIHVVHRCHHFFVVRDTLKDYPSYVPIESLTGCYWAECARPTVEASIEILVFRLNAPHLCENLQGQEFGVVIQNRLKVIQSLAFLNYAILAPYLFWRPPSYCWMIAEGH